MNKIVFIGIILLSGLFSLQYSLVGPRSTKTLEKGVIEPSFQTNEITEPETKYQVIYICPDDTTKIQKIREAFKIML
ncbi:hypothetical protein N9I68_01490 [Bacteroidia bacterium]|nr:hypothetical protein [Bacteroidia bacterium]